MSRPRPVLGHHAPPPRITRRAVRLVAIWVGLPVIAVCFALDVILTLN